MEAITHPLKVIQRLAAAPGENVKEYFAKLVSDPTFRSQVGPSRMWDI
jgi:hypothetical protein